MNGAKYEVITFDNIMAIQGNFSIFNIFNMFSR